MGLIGITLITGVSILYIGLLCLINSELEVVCELDD